jgi:hypothetical protein
VNILARVRTFGLHDGPRDRTASFGRAVAAFLRRMYRGRFAERCFVAAAVAALVLSNAPAARSDVQIAGLTDLNLGTWTGTGDLTGDISHCVQNTVAPGKYSIEASGDGSGGAFALINGVTSIPMQLSYSDGSGWSSLTPNSPLGNLKGLKSSGFSQCMSGKNPYLIRVLILQSDLSLANDGTYGGTIYLNVVPQ